MTTAATDVLTILLITAFVQFNQLYYTFQIMRFNGLATLLSTLLCVQNYAFNRIATLSSTFATRECHLSHASLASFLSYVLLCSTCVYVDLF